MKNQIEHLIILCSKRHKGKVTKPVTAKFTWYEENRRRDKDNIAFAKKFIFDGLVKAGVLKGDGWDYVAGFSDDFKVDKHKPRVEIEIREVE